MEIMDPGTMDDIAGAMARAFLYAEWTGLDPRTALGVVRPQPDAGRANLPMERIPEDGADIPAIPLPEARPLVCLHLGEPVEDKGKH